MNTEKESEISYITPRDTSSLPHFFEPSNEFLTLKTLEAIHKNPKISQRELAKDLNVALGFANACIKNMAKRGYVKFQKAKGKKLLYLITPTGLREKSNLSYNAFVNTVSFYSSAKQTIRNFFDNLERENIKKLSFYKVYDLLEVIFIVLKDFNFEVIGIINDDEMRFDKEYYLGVKVYDIDATEIRDSDAVILTHPQRYFDDEKKIKSELFQIKIMKVF